MISLLFTISWVGGIGQVIPGQLRSVNVQNKIVKLTADFDSVIFVDIAGFYNEDFKIEGFGFRGSAIYKLKILFKDFADYELSEFRKKRILKQKRVSAIRAINYSMLKTFNNDSLSIKSRTGTSVRISDHDDWTALMIVGKNMVIKQSYAPEIYQQTAPTKEREMFMNIIKRVIALIED